MVPVAHSAPECFHQPTMAPSEGQAAVRLMQASADVLFDAVGVTRPVVASPRALLLAVAGLVIAVHEWRRAWPHTEPWG